MSPFDRRQALQAATAALAARPASTAVGAPDGAAPADPFATLNTSFRALYAANRDELVEAVPLAAATFIGSAEILRIEHGRIVRTYPPTVAWIAEAKGLLHGLIALQATGARLVRGAAPDAARRDAVHLAALLEEATRLAATLPESIAPAAGRILGAAGGLARRWAETGRATAGDTLAALTPVHDDLTAVLDETGAAVYGELVAGLHAFRDDSTPEAWADCLVLVCGPPFARRDSIEIAAGMEVLGRDALGVRLLYVDNVSSPDAAATQVGGCLADRDLGRDVFGDPMRMWRDLLGDTSRRKAGGGFFPFMGVA